MVGLESLDTIPRYHKLRLLIYFSRHKNEKKEFFFVFLKRGRVFAACIG